jgi:hypothetical protein
MNQEEAQQARSEDRFARMQQRMLAAGPALLRGAAAALVVLVVVFLLLATVGATAASRQLLVGLAVAWLALAGLIYWAVVTYQRYFPDGLSDGAHYPVEARPDNDTDAASN